jgi:hypothetical protein
MGSRVLRVNMVALTSLMRWPFPDTTTVTIEGHRLPADCAFVGVLKIEPPGFVYVRLASSKWRGDTDELLPQPEWKYTGKGHTITLPTADEISTLRRGH